MNKQLDKIGEEAARLLGGMERDRKLAQPLVDQVFTAFEVAKKNRVAIAINGTKGKTEWAEKFAKVTLRYAQYVRKDGTRKRGKDGDTNPVRSHNVNVGDVLVFGKRKFKVVGIGDPVFPHLEDEQGLCRIEGLAEYDHNVLFRLKEIDPKPQQKTDTKRKEKRVPVRHVPDLRLHTKAKYAGRSLCDVKLSEKTTPTKKNPPNCKKCIELAKTIDNKLIVVLLPAPPKVKKITPGETATQIRLAESDFKYESPDDQTHKMQPDGKQTWCGKTPGRLWKHGIAYSWNYVASGRPIEVLAQHLRALR